MWLHTPKTFCPSSQELEDLISESSSLTQTLELSVTLSGKHTVRPFLWNAWKKRPWIRLLYGTILRPSMASHGVESWIQSLAGSRVKTYPSQDNKRVFTKEQDPGFFTSMLESFAKYVPDTSSWKMLEGYSSNKRWKQSSKSWPTWGSMRNGVCSLAKEWEPAINVSECLYWRSPQAQEPGVNPNRLTGEFGHRMYDKETGRLAQVGLTQQAVAWRTPSASDPVGGVKDLNDPKYANADAPKIKLSDQVVAWRTPIAGDGTHNHCLTPAVLANKTTLTLSNQVNITNWPTPVTQDLKKRGPNSKQQGLAEEASIWPTPTTRDYKGAVTGKSIDRKDGKSRKDQLCTIAVHNDLQVPNKQTNGKKSSNTNHDSPLLKKRLNPTFVEWLMGLPIGWSLPIPTEVKDYKHWETESIQWLRRLLGQY